MANCLQNRCGHDGEVNTQSGIRETPGFTPILGATRQFWQKLVKCPETTRTDFRLILKNGTTISTSMRMDDANWTAFYLLAQSSGSSIEHLLTHAPRLAKECPSALLATLPADASIAPLLRPPSEELASLHPSWIAEALSSQPKELIAIYLSLFSSERQVAIQSLLETPSQPIEISKELLPFFKRALAKLLLPNFLLPIEYLPPSPLLPLAGASWQQLALLPTVLGFVDLGQELRRTIDKKVFDRIARILSPLQRATLKHCCATRYRFSTLPLPLASWKGDSETFQEMIFERSFCYLSSALIEQPEPLRWRIIRRFDKKYEQRLASVPSATPPFSSQEAATVIAQALAINPESE